MKKMFAIFFLSIYLISTTEFSQLLKFPILIEHFIEHKEKNPKLSVVDFLVLHYNNHLENHPRDDDYDQDQKLPFMAQTDILTLCFIYAPPLSYKIKADIPVNSESKVFPFNDT